MKKIFLRPTIIMILIAASTFAQHDSTAQDANNIKRFRFKYTLSDGVDLIADMYYPDPLKKHPAIFIRTPYNKKQHSSLGEFLAKHGYVVVIQDVRGTGQSKGNFIPFANEIRDGMEMLGWIEGQDWYNGQIGMWGGSYLSYCAAVLACQNPPSLKSVFSISGGYNLEKSILPGGAFHLMMNAAWFHFSKSQQDTSLKKINVNDLMNTVPLENAFEKINAKRELTGISSLLQNLKSLEPPTNAAYFHLTGWYDFFNVLTFDLYEKIKKSSGSINKIMVGPWYHDQIYTEKSIVGDEDFGSASILGYGRLKQLSLEWFDFTLKGKKNGFSERKDVTLFVMNENKWKEFNNWPADEINFQKWYLNNKDKKNKKGELTINYGNESSRFSFIFDPYKPAPTVGGSNFHFFPNNLGIKDQSEVEKRNDVLVYTSQEIKKELTIAGNIKISLFASTEGSDTDFTAKLVELRKDGYARIITEGITRLSRTGMFNTIQLGDTLNFTIDLGYTAIKIPGGSKLILEISSSNFPKYDRNPNTGENSFTAATFKSVNQTVYHGGTTASFITLPVISNNDEEKTNGK